MLLKYRNITISGGIGVGTTTLMNNIKPYLEPHGWQCTSTGQYVRELTKENTLPVATLVSDDTDRKIEERVYKTLRDESHWIIEGWLAGFVARELTDVLRILVICTEPSLRVDRVANRDKLSIPEAKQFIKLREEKNLKKWNRLYGTHNFFDKKHYQVVIDTYTTGQLEAVGKVLDAMGYPVKMSN